MKYLKAVMFAFALILLSCTQEKAVEKPNIVFIFADDQCHNTVNALGNKEIITPNLDKLVENGVTFTHAYNMGAWNGAVCAASRAMLNTGRSVWRTHAYESHQKDLVDRGEMWGQLMKKAGYKTYMTGKWHVKTHPTQLFDSVVHVRPGMPGDAYNKKYWEKILENRKELNVKRSSTSPLGYGRPVSKEDTAWQPWDQTLGGFWEGGKHWSEVLGDDALGFIADAKKHDDPFFMYLAFNAAHDPRQSPKEFVDMYPLENISVPETFMPLYPYKDSIGCGPGLRDEALAPFPRTAYAIKVHRQEYYALITHLDQQIGRIIAALKESGKMDNTYIFYTADHGLAIGNHGLVGKQNMYDHSIRPPLFVIGPDIPKNKKVDADVYLQDVMASAIDLAGLPKPEYIEFSSLMPLARGEQTASNYDAIYGCYLKDMQRMIRKDGFKLIVYPHGKTMLLFDMTKDPLEMNDLAQDPAYQEKKMSLFKDLLQLQKDMDDPMDLSKYFAMN